MTESAKPLPTTGGVSLCQQWTRCGRAGCRCARGELHGPYWYLFWREGGRLKKRYVRRADIDAMREAVADHRHALTLNRELLRLSRTLFRDDARELQEYERWRRQQ